MPTTPVFYVFDHQAESFIQLSCTYETVEHDIYFFQQIFWVQSNHGKVVGSVSPILHLTVHQKVFARF